MKKALRWVWFAFGCCGAELTCTHACQRLDRWDAVLVTALIVAWLIRWFTETLRYQWNIPKAEYKP